MIVTRKNWGRYLRFVIISSVVGWSDCQAMSNTACRISFWMVHPQARPSKLTSASRHCQSRGDWSQRMASLTSEYDSNSFVGEEMQHQLSHYFSSFTKDMNRDTQYPFVPAVQKGKSKDYGHVPGVRVHVFCFSLYVNSLSSPVNGYSEERWPKANVGVHSHRPVLITMASSTSSELLYNTVLYSVVLWLCKNRLANHQFTKLWPRTPEIQIENTKPDKKIQFLFGKLGHGPGE